jgi:hypothetical protein
MQSALEQAPEGAVKVNSTRDSENCCSRDLVQFKSSNWTTPSTGRMAREGLLIGCSGLCEELAKIASLGDDHGPRRCRRKSSRIGTGDFQWARGAASKAKWEEALGHKTRLENKRIHCFGLEQVAQTSRRSGGHRAAL